MELKDLKQAIDLEKFLIEYGFSKNKEKSTRSIPVFENGSDRLIVRQGNDCKIYYVAGTNEKGTIIDFLKNRPQLLHDFPAGNIFESIKKCLTNYIGNRPLTEDSYKENDNINTPFSPSAFFIPNTKDIKNRCFSYLSFRGITQKTLDSPVFSNIGLVKIENSNDKYYNLAFPLFDKDGNIKAIDYRFQTNGKSYKMLLPGSDKKHSVGISSDKREGIKELILTESPIDAMSHYQLLRSGHIDIQYMYFDGTMSKEQIALFLEYRKKINPIVTCGFDNDPDGKLTGQAYTTSILSSLIADTPVTLSYEGKQKFSFVISQPELKRLFTNILNNTGVLFYEKENLFSFSFPKEKSIINKINNALASALDSKVRIERPITNDWNDDLKLKEKMPIQARNEKNIGPHF